MVLMEDGSEQYVEVNFQMHHPQCWTEVTENLKVNIHTVSSSVYRDRNYIFGTIEVKSESENEFKNFIRNFKHSAAVKELLRVSVSPYRRNLYDVTFREKYESMIASVLYENGAIYHNDLISENFEYIMAIVPGENVRDLRTRLSDIGEMPYFYMKNTMRTERIDGAFNLTEQEAFALYMAYQNGYFNIPREKYLTELSAVTGLSKSALEEYMRKATGKIIREWAEKNRFFLSKKFKK
ncbi:MAG: helix-turn-helix domain-containing protein [Ferroplasma sp.]|uniref:helix-turn-helix domain-containing protein n=1 Tax=Ferroplasma sp. TaxID=2591003 RepID=UPI00281632E7|nr:helix-turn-helix domain-containing protein [Ferroplasma sp.]WMT51092.1 MAG: helix-turn-helix domain-containing protein [Ferroplasma sp.]